MKSEKSGLSSFFFFRQTVIWVALVKLKHDCFTIAALLYSAFGVVIEKARGAEDDINTVAAGTLTGMVFKSAGGSLLCLYLPVYSKPPYVLHC